MKYFILISIVLGLHNCSPKTKSLNLGSEVNFLYKESQGSIAVKSVGFGNNQETAEVNAEQNAFYVVLFRGIPGTEQNIPLVENEQESKSKHVKYFENFFEKGYYKTFMMSSIISSKLSKSNSGKTITLNVKININSLRKDLEQNQIIRKFGF
jgi:hypothetical protein